MSARLVLPLHVECLPLLDQKRERAPSMDVWLTQNVSAVFDVLQLPADGRAALEFDVERDIARGDAGLQALAAANLNLDLWVLMDNKHSEMCRVPAGCAMVPLGLVCTAEQTVRLTYPVLPDGCNAKGVLRVKLRAPATLDGAPLATAMQRAGVRWALEAAERTPDPLRAYIDAAERAYSPYGVRSTYAALNNVNMFEYVSRVGVLPAAGYVNTPIGATGEAYFLNVARLALARLGLREEDALQRWDLERSGSDARAAANWLATALSLYVQYCDYMEDKVVAAVCTRGGGVRYCEKPIEWFQHVRVRNGCGDCEDLATETVIEAAELERLRAAHPLVQLLQRVNAGFYCVLLLDGVSNAEINDSDARAGRMPAEMEAHMNSALVSRYFVHQWLDDNGGRAAAPGRPNALFPSIVMLEGTGPLDPDGLKKPDDIAEQLRDQMLMPYRSLMREVRQVFYYDATGRSDSGFYRAVKLMAARNIDPSRFLWLLSPSKQAKSAGVSFRQIAAGSTEIAAVGEAPFSPEALRVMERYKLDLHPLVSLEAPSERRETPEEVERARAQMTALAQRIQALIPAGPDATRHTVVVLVKYSHFDAQGQFATRLFEAVRRSTDSVPLVAFRCVEERVTQDRGGYHLRFGWPEVKRV